jgi:uncharacterized membrane protein
MLASLCCSLCFALALLTQWEGIQRERKGKEKKRKEKKKRKKKKRKEKNKEQLIVWSYLTLLSAIPS